jgi:hypothetical protein
MMVCMPDVWIHGPFANRVIDEATWTPKIKELLEAKEIWLRGYDVELDYNYWSYRELRTVSWQVELDDC